MTMLPHADDSLRTACKPSWLAPESDFSAFGVRHRHPSAGSSGIRQQLGQAAQVHGGHGQRERLSGGLPAAHLQLAQRAVLLGVTEDGLDEFANDLTDRVSGVTSRAFID